MGGGLVAAYADAGEVSSGCGAQSPVQVAFNEDAGEQPPQVGEVVLASETRFLVLTALVGYAAATVVWWITAASCRRTAGLA